MQFSCSYVHGDDGPFQIISDLNEIPCNKEVSQYIRYKIKENFFSPRYIEGSTEKKGWPQFAAYVFYGNALYVVTFTVLPNGKIDIGNSDLVLDELPILQRQYAGVFRTPLRSLYH